MKKILLATTIVAMSAGFAAAEIKFSGSATAGLAKDGVVSDDSVDDKIHTYSSADLAVEFVGESDNGLAFGATFDLSVGKSYSFADDEGFNDEGGAFTGMPEVYVSGAFGKIAFATDDYDFFDDANGGGDVKYTGSFAGVSIGLIADIETKNASASLGYAINGIALAADYDSYNVYNVSAAYTFNSITATVATNEADEHSLKLAYAQDAFSGSVKFITGNDWELAAGYSANGMALNASTNKAQEWEVTGSYDLGGGLSAEGGVNYSKDAFVGVKMSF